MAVLRRIALILVCLSTVLFVASRIPYLWRKPFVPLDVDYQRPYTYRGNDFPNAWSIPRPLADVEIFHEDTVHYALHTDLGIAEWNTTLPSGGALVYLGPDYRPFTLSIFHQLRCLNILREILVEFYLDPSPSAAYKQPILAEHCMNYLRQTSICRADLHLENVRAASGAKVTNPEISHSCRDWTAVYEAAEENYKEFVAYADSDSADLE